MNQAIISVAATPTNKSDGFTLSSAYFFCVVSSLNVFILDQSRYRHRRLPHFSRVFLREKWGFCKMLALPSRKIHTRTRLPVRANISATHFLANARRTPALPQRRHAALLLLSRGIISGAVPGGGLIRIARSLAGTVGLGAL